MPRSGTSDRFLAGLTQAHLDATIERGVRTGSGASLVAPRRRHSREHIGQATLTRQLARTGHGTTAGDLSDRAAGLSPAIGFREPEEP